MISQPISCGTNLLNPVRQPSYFNYSKPILNCIIVDYIVSTAEQVRD